MASLKSFQTYPPTISGDTVSNLILVNYLDTLYGESELSKDTQTFGFCTALNSRDIYLNVNALKAEPKSKLIRQCITTLNHESIHNTITKYVDERSSRELDNLFYNERLVKKIKKELFGIGKSGKIPKKYRRKNSNNKTKLADDFWLMGVNF